MRRLRLILLHILAWIAGPLVRQTNGPVTRILYIKPDHLGDLLLATPALAALRAHFPAAHITTLVGPWSQIVVQHTPRIDTILTCPFPGFTRTTKPTPWQPYVTLVHIGLLLRVGGYDLALLGRDDHWWGAALALIAGIPHRVGFAVPECRPFLTTALPWEPQTHVTTQGIALVAAASATYGTAHVPADEHFPTRFEPKPHEVAWAKAWLQAQGIGTHAALIVLHPGTGGMTKLWSAERWVIVADTLMQDGVQFVITGGPDEEALVEQIASAMRVRPPTLAGQTTIGQLAALLRQARLVMGVDSGPLHLAVAQQVATLHLYGPGNAARFGPWGDPKRQRVISAELWCSPCGVFHACPRGLAQPACMERISPSLVIAQARHMLAERSVTHS